MIHAISRRRVLAAGAASALGMPAVVRAAEKFPSRPFVIINSSVPGGYLDNLARALTPFLSKELGESFSVQNVLGGDGMLATMRVLQLPPDGYTLYVAGVNTVVVTILTQKTSYKLDDLAMINLPARDFTLMATSAENAKLKSVDDVVKALQANPKALSIGVQPISTDTINLAFFAQAIGVRYADLRIATYDGGGAVRSAVVGGVIDIGLAGGEGFLPLQGLSRPLLTFDDQKRAPFDAPCVKDVTFKAPLDFVPGTVRGFCLPATVKSKYPERYERLVDAFEKAFKDPATLASLQKQQLATTWYGPQASDAAYHEMFAQLQKYAGLLKKQ